MDVVDFGPEHIRPAAACHAAAVRWIRELVPEIPDTFEEEDGVAALLEDVEGVAAIDEDRLIGYLVTTGPIPRFRRTHRTGAYVPAWGHGVTRDHPEPIYRAMYARAAAQWHLQGCNVHAISILDHDPDATDAWFRMGFGMLLVDAVVTNRPSVTAPARMATPADADALAALDREHAWHYAAPPTSMAIRAAMDAERWRAFLADARFGASIVEVDGEPVGFMRFSDDHPGAFIDAAYVRPEARGRGLAGLLLAAGMDHLASRGITHVALDYESTNPTAASFWPRWTTPVSHSLQRILE